MSYVYRTVADDLETILEAEGPLTVYALAGIFEHGPRTETMNFKAINVCLRRHPGRFMVVGKAGKAYLWDTSKTTPTL